MTLHGLCATGNVSSWNGQFEIIDIEKVTADQFGRPNVPGCPAFVDADEVRHYIAEWSSAPSSNKIRDQIIQKLLNEGHVPPRAIKWKAFYKLVRDACNGWLGDRRPAHGFGDKQIQRAVKDLRSN
jgi:hypothetical protein